MRDGAVKGKGLMGSVFVSGFLTGLLLQVAIGPVFFFILNTAIQKTLLDGLLAVLAVTLVDYLYILLAMMGVGKVLEKPRIKHIMGIVGSIALVVLGLIMIISTASARQNPAGTSGTASTHLSSFLSALFLTLSSPLTVVFWTSLFATKAVEKGYSKKRLLLFGLSAGLATFVFLGLSVAGFTFIKSAIPPIVIRILNIGVGLLLIAYGGIRFARLLIVVRSKSATATSKEDLRG
jgi:threonine/homoserine/homoserine lactone efflux protein